MKQNCKSFVVRTLVFTFVCLLMAVPQTVCAAGGAHINWHVKDVTITDGCCEVRIAFSNDGDMAAEMTQAEMTVDVTYKGKVFFSVYKKFDMNGLYVWGGAPQRTFVFWDSRFKKEQNYTGKTPYGWRVHDGYVWWNNVRP